MSETAMKQGEMIAIDLHLPPQECTSVHMEFKPAYALFREKMVCDHKIPLQCFAPWWFHTHPSGVNKPSLTDEDTFANPDIFGDMDYAMMMILTREDIFYCRLRHNGGLFGGIAVETAPEINFYHTFRGVTQEDLKAWEKEYKDNVEKKTYQHTYPYSKNSRSKGKSYYSSDKDTKNKKSSSKANNKKKQKAWYERQSESLTGLLN